MTRSSTGTLCVLGAVFGIVSCSPSGGGSNATPASSARPADPGSPAAAELDTTRGAWEAPFDHDTHGFAHTIEHFHAAHLALIPVGPRRGQVLAWNEPEVAPQGSAWVQQWSVIDPSATPSFDNDELAMPDGLGDLFCSGHSWLPNGKLLVVGGTTEHGTREGLIVGGKLAYLYDPYLPGNAAWTRLPDMAADRWYPTTTVLASGDVMVAGGSEDSVSHFHNDFELFDPSTNTWRVVSGGGRLFSGPATTRFDTYPRIHQLASGSIFLSGMSAACARAQWDGSSATWSETGSTAFGYRLFGASLLFAGRGGGDPDRVFVLGGETTVGNTTWARRSMETCTASSANPVWTRAASMLAERGSLNAVLLPDASILAIGGHGSGWLPGAQQLPLFAERFDGERWIACAAGASPRDYHSAAVLLPDGRVLAAGGESRTSDYQIYRPWYLTTGALRPEIVSAPETIGTVASGVASFGVTHAPLPIGREIDHAVLLRPGTITHHSDFDARYVRLRTTSTSPTTVRVEAPADTKQTPRGWYMLFLLSNERVPSVAAWVKVP